MLFDVKKKIQKWGLDDSTFDSVDIVSFRNYTCATLSSYIIMYVMIILGWVLLASDIYTCLNILVFKKWGTGDYQTYEYKTAKWIFAGCIIFQFVLTVYHLMWALPTYRTKNIALTYVNNIAKTIYSLNYYIHCIYNEIEHDNFLDWAAFYCYQEIDNAAQLLIADAPRQVINIMTLRQYATAQDTNNDIFANIKEIADTNLRLSVILSFMCLSFVIWSIFIFKFMFAMIILIPIKVKLSKKDFKSLKKYCCFIVNKKVKVLVRKHSNNPQQRANYIPIQVPSKGYDSDQNSSDSHNLTKPLAHSISKTYTNNSSDNLKLGHTISMADITKPIDSSMRRKPPTSDSNSNYRNVDGNPYRDQNLLKSSLNHSASSLTDPFQDSNAVQLKPINKSYTTPSRMESLGNSTLTDNSSAQGNPMKKMESYNSSSMSNNSTLRKPIKKMDSFTNSLDTYTDSTSNINTNGSNLRNMESFSTLNNQTRSDASVSNITDPYSQNNYGNLYKIDSAGSQNFSLPTDQYQNNNYNTSNPDLNNQYNQYNQYSNEEYPTRQDSFAAVSNEYTNQYNSQSPYENDTFATTTDPLTENLFNLPEVPEIYEGHERSGRQESKKAANPLQIIDSYSNVPYPVNEYDDDDDEEYEDEFENAPHIDHSNLSRTANGSQENFSENNPFTDITHIEQPGHHEEYVNVSHSDNNYNQEFAGFNDVMQAPFTGYTTEFANDTNHCTSEVPEPFVNVAHPGHAGSVKFTEQPFLSGYQLNDGSHHTLTDINHNFGNEIFTAHNASGASIHNTESITDSDLQIHGNVPPRSTSLHQRQYPDSRANSISSFGSNTDISLPHANFNSNGQDKNMYPY